MFIRIVIPEQIMYCSAHEGASIDMEFPVSTAANGCGELIDSYCTPRGLHRIEEKIGAGLRLNSVFVGRVFTGEFYNEEHDAKSNKDWIVTRILRLRGLENGINAGVNSNGICCDSWERYIYIHGTPEQNNVGKPGSRGCVRMRNIDIVDLFDKVCVGTLVRIEG